MVGQGSPLAARIIRTDTSKHSLVWPRWLARMLVVLCALSYSSFCLAIEPLNLQIRVSWGNGDRRLWRGSISVSEGVLQSPRCLGIESDAPNRYQLQENSFQFQQRTPMTLDGFDLRLIAAEDAILSIHLEPMDQPTAAKTVEIDVADFIPANPVVHESQLDDRRNRLVVQRTPGDRMRVQFERSSLVFSPGEQFSFEVEPHLLGLGFPEGTALRCAMQMTLSGSDEVLWKEQHDVRVDATGSVNTIGPAVIGLPADEGVYDILISLSKRSFSDALVPGKPQFQRKLQLIVIGAQPQLPEERAWTIEEFDSADPKWWARALLLAKKLPGIAPKGPLGDKPLRAVDRAGERLQELGPLGWHAAPIPISQIGLPHILEVEFPRGVRQTLGISILEADAAGDVGSKGLDSGIDVADDSQIVDGMEKHRLIFWPRTKTPWLLLTNRRDNAPALFGKMRVYSGPAQLPQSALGIEVENRRLAAAHFDKPLFTDNFGAPEALDINSNRSLRDWNTFYLGAMRLAEYLKFAGYNAAFIPVACDGTTLYPTKLLDVMPKWDNGTFFVSAQDPRPKDVLEVMFRIFDREGLKLIPVLQFGNTLPELEATLLQENNVMNGITLIGSYRNETALNVGASDARRGLAPTYNPLDPRVQAAMRRVAAELLARCRTHPSFGGLSLQLNPYGYSQLPDETWGLDDTTFARFAREQEIVLDASQQSYAVRLALTRGALREPWLQWRAFQLAAFYSQLQAEVAQIAGDAPLYLDLHELMVGRVVQSGIRPQLPPRDQIADALLRHGIDPLLWSGHRELVVLRPHRIGPSTALASQATNIELGNSTFVDDYFRSASFAGIMTFHERQTLRVPGFDAVSPFGPNKTYTWLSTHVSSPGDQSRKNFIHSLVMQDATVLANGGWMLPLGQEEALRPVLQVLTQLPADRFETVLARDADNSSITVRSLTQQNRTFIYVANASGLRAKVDLQLQNVPGDAQFDLLTDRKPSPVTQAMGNSIGLQLDRYDLVGFAIRAPGARVVNWSVDYEPADVSQVKRRVQEFAARVDGLRNQRPIDVLENPGFEKPLQENQIPGWTCTPPMVAEIRLDKNAPRTGQAALHFQSTGANAVAKLRSNPFPLPRTGRLSVLAYLRIRDASGPPALCMTIEGRRASGAPINIKSLGALGKAVDGNLRPTGAPARPLPTDWSNQSNYFLFNIVDLPADTPGEVSVGLDMLGAGEVWIDDVQVYDLNLNDAERNELVKQVGNVQLQLNSGKYAACQQFLEGFWPRFVMEFTPAPVRRIAQAPTAGSKAEAPPAKPEDKSWFKVPKNPLKPLKEFF